GHAATLPRTRCSVGELSTGRDCAAGRDRSAAACAQGPHTVRAGRCAHQPALTHEMCGSARGLAEDPVEVGATDRALALGHATTVGLHNVALSLALLLALHAVELAL